MKTVLTLLVWWGIFCFITGEINPMLWSAVAKMFAVIVALLVVGNED